MIKFNKILKNLNLLNIVLVIIMYFIWFIPGFFLFGITNSFFVRLFYIFTLIFIIFSGFLSTKQIDKQEISIINMIVIATNVFIICPLIFYLIYVFVIVLSKID